MRYGENSGKQLGQQNMLVLKAENEALTARVARLEQALREIMNEYGDPNAEDNITTIAREALQEPSRE